MAKGQENGITTLLGLIKITFDEGRDHSQGLKIPFIRITSLLEKYDQGCAYNLGLTNPGNWLLSILITLFPV
jgi:hypothetical protein